MRCRCREPSSCVTVAVVIIGILSDSHDREETMAAALRLLAGAGAEFYIHCGDIGSERCIDLLAGLKSAFVFGNTDFDRAGLARYAASIDVPCYGNFADLTLAGKRIAVIHGDDFKLKQRLVHEQAHDYLMQGHTHIRADEKIGKTRLINPGALHRAAQKTVATLDTERDKLNYVTVTPTPKG
jgi:putative phosphoesterase